MTLTPAPAMGGFFAICDGCHQTVEVAESAPLPDGWTWVYLREYVGAFAACSDECAAKIRRRDLARKER